MKMKTKIIRLAQAALLAVPGKRMKTKLIVLILTELALAIIMYTAISLCGGMSDVRWIRIVFL